MADARDITMVDEAAWKEAVARELVLRRLAGQQRLDRAEVLAACRELGAQACAALSASAGLQDPPGGELAGQPRDGIASGRASPVRRRRGADRRGDPDLLPDASEAERQRVAQGSAAALLAKRRSGAQLACGSGEGEDYRSERPRRGPRGGEGGSGTASGRFPVNTTPTMRSRSCKSIIRWWI